MVFRSAHIIINGGGSMKKVLCLFVCLVLPFLLVSGAFSQNKTKSDVVNDLNARLQANNSPFQLMDFDDANFVQGAISYKGQGAFGNKEVKLLTGNTYENNSSVAQQVSFTVSETITKSNNWNVTAGLEVGASITTEIEGGIPGLGSAKSSVEGSVKVSASAGKGGSDEVSQNWSETRNITIAPYKIMRVCASVNEQKSTNVPFTIPLYAKGTFKVVPRDVAKLYRFYKSGDHFYTTAEHEGIGARYAGEGVTCLIHTKQYPGSVVLHRLYNSRHNDHLYSTNKAEGTNVGYSYEGPVGYVYTAESRPGLVPLHRFYNGGNNDHFYTLSRNEGAAARGYAYEGVACYVFPNDYRESIKIEDSRMLPNPDERKFLVEGVANAARQIDTTVSMNEDSIPQAERSGSRSNRISKRELMDSDKNLLIQQIKQKFRLR
jgi:hypothetical protein